MTDLVNAGFPGLLLGMLLGLYVGCHGEWSAHRRYCLCKTCTQWRERVMEKARRLTGSGGQ